MTQAIVTTLFVIACMRIPSAQTDSVVDTGSTLTTVVSPTGTLRRSARQAPRHHVDLIPTETVCLHPLGDKTDPHTNYILRVVHTTPSANYSVMVKSYEPMTIEGVDYGAPVTYIKENRRCDDPNKRLTTLTEEIMFDFSRFFNGFGSHCYSNAIVFWYRMSMFELFDEVRITGATPNPLTYRLTTPGLDELSDDGATRGCHVFPPSDHCTRVYSTGCSEKAENSVCESYTAKRPTSTPTGADRVMRAYAADNTSYRCRCVDGYETLKRRPQILGGDSKMSCRDIQECAVGGTTHAHTCSPTSEVCLNGPGSYECMSTSVSQTPVACPTSDTSHPLVRIGGPDNPEYERCMNSTVVLPEEINCNVSDTYDLPIWVKIFLPFYGLEGFSTRPNMNMTVTVVTTQETLHETIFSAACKTTPFPMFGSHDLAQRVAPYTRKEHISIPPDMQKYFKEQSIHTLERVNEGVMHLLCHSNALVLWGKGTLGNVRKVSIPNYPAGQPATTIHREYTRNPSTPLDGQCEKLGASDKCFGGQANQRCPPASSICVDKPDGVPYAVDGGRYGCDCLPGYTPENDQCVVNVQCSSGFNLVNKTCVDINECEMGTPCAATHEVCENTRGGFNCINGKTCPAGRKLNKRTNECVDVDECLLGTDNCDRNTTRCINTPDSYRCLCKSSVLKPETGEIYKNLSHCVPVMLEYRILDPSKIRCCGHYTDTAVFLVKGRVNERGQFTQVTPVACLHASEHDLSRYTRAQLAKSFVQPYLLHEKDSSELE